MIHINGKSERESGIECKGGSRIESKSVSGSGSRSGSGSGSGIEGRGKSESKSEGWNESKVES